MHHHGQAKNIPKWVSSVLMFWNAYHHAYLHPESSITPLEPLITLSQYFVSFDKFHIHFMFVDFKWSFSVLSNRYQRYVGTRYLVGSSAAASRHKGRETTNIPNASMSKSLAVCGSFFFQWFRRNYAIKLHHQF